MHGLMEQKKLAERTLAEFLAKNHDQELILLIGAGNEFLIKALRNLLKSNQKLFILDANPITIDYSHLENTYFSCGDSTQTCLDKLHKIITEEVYYLRFKICLEISDNSGRNKAVKKIENYLIPKLRSKMEIVRDCRHIDEISFQNILLNLPSIKTSKGLKFIKRPDHISTAIIVGAGPSLDTQINWLKKNRDYFFIIAAGATVKAFKNHNIIPDYYVEIDRCALRNWDNIKIDEADKLLCSPTISPGLAPKFDHAYWFISSHNILEKTIVTPFNKDVDRLFVGTNVGVAAGSFAIYLGFKKIILLGIDLCCTISGSTHSAFHSCGEDTLHSLNNRISNYLEVENNVGEKRYTVFDSLINSFEELIQQNLSVEIIQASPEGVKLKGAKFIPFDKISLPKSKPSPHPTPILIETHNDLTSKEARTPFNHLLKEITSINDYNYLVNNRSNKMIDSIKFIIDHHILSRNHWDVYSTSDINKIKNYETQIFKNKLIKIITELKHITNEAINTNAAKLVFQQYFQTNYPHAGITCDYMFEVDRLEYADPKIHSKLKTYYSSYPQPANDDFLIFCPRKHMVQLRKWDNKSNTYIPTIGNFDLVEYAKDILINHINVWSKSHKVIEKAICIGVFDANYLYLFKEKFPNIPIILIEPSFCLFAEVLRYVPLVSILGPNTRYILNINGKTFSNELEKIKNEQSLNPNIITICPDPMGKYCPKLKNNLLQDLIKTGSN